MKVCVGITTWNRAGILPKAIESALAQDYPDKEIIVYDDGSNDDTPALQRRFPTVRWVRSEQNAGCILARNTVMAMTTADLYCSLDDDAWFTQTEALTNAVSCFSDPKVAAVAFDVLSPDRPEPSTRAVPRQMHVFIGCGHILRLEALNQVGFYQPSPGTYGSEESDLSVRLLDAGFDIVFMPGVHIWHDRAANARDLPAQYRSSVCNDLAFSLRRFPMPDLLWHFPAKLFNHLRFALRHRMVRPFLAGIALFVRACAPTLRSRRPIQRGTLAEFCRRKLANVRA